MRGCLARVEAESSQTSVELTHWHAYLSVARTQTVQLKGLNDFGNALDSMNEV